MKIELINFMGDDLTVVNSARVSFDKESEWENITPAGPIDHLLTEKDTKLINYLAKHNHFTPFTHCTITMRETVPIFVARQRFKHTIGFSYNEVSRRYVSDDPEFFYPDVWRDTSYYVTGSLYAWARAYNLRSEPHAQEEIQFVAKYWDTIIKELFPTSWEALTNE